MNKKAYFLGIVICTIVVVCIHAYLGGFKSKDSCISEEPDSLVSDSLFIDTYNTMTKEEFYKEMMKGVQGDFTLEQIDSMQKIWAILDSMESNNQ